MAKIQIFSVIIAFFGLQLCAIGENTMKNALDLSEVEDYKIKFNLEIIPSEAKTFYEGLTDDDRVVLKNVLSKGSQYSNISEVLHDLRNGSTALYDKAVNLVTSIRQIVSSLSPPARKFVDDTVDQIRRALGETFSFNKIKAEANVVVERYRALDESSKTELKNSFPIVADIVNNSVFQTLSLGLLGITAE